MLRLAKLPVVISYDSTCYYIVQCNFVLYFPKSLQTTLRWTAMLCHVMVCVAMACLQRHATLYYTIPYYISLAR